MHKRVPLVCLLALAVLLFVVPLGAQETADDGRMEFDIEAQPLSSALRAFSDQSNLQVLYASELVADYDSPGVVGF